MPIRDYRFQPSDSAHSRLVGEEAVILQLQSGDYFSLDPVGSFVWQRITQGPIGFADLLRDLISEYDCEEIGAASDLEDLCGQLLAEELIELA